MLLAFTNNQYLMIMTFGVIFICGLMIGYGPTMREVRRTLREFREINEEQQEPQYNWGDWFINYEGREVQLPSECPEGFQMTAEDFVRMNRWYPSEND